MKHSDHHEGCGGLWVGGVCAQCDACCRCPRCLWSVRGTEQQGQFDAAYATGLDLIVWRVFPGSGHSIDVYAVNGHGAVLVAREERPDADWSHYTAVPDAYRNAPQKSFLPTLATL